VTIKTKAENLFEKFCTLNKIKCEKVIEGSNQTPDYKVFFNNIKVYVEVKQIDKDENFGIEVGNGIKTSERTLGKHIRKKIEKARKQAQVVSKKSIPLILLIYNNIDSSFQLFGTEQHDFLTAMYGEWTLTFDKNENGFTDYFYGKNGTFKNDKNTSFSAVGCLTDIHDIIKVKLYENVFAKNKLDFYEIPKSIEVTRIELK